MIIPDGPYIGQEAKYAPTSYLREYLRTLPLSSDLGQEIRFILLERIRLYQPAREFS